MVEANRDRGEDMRIVFRIGLHLGDLIVEGDDLYGEGMNGGARLSAARLSRHSGGAYTPTQTPRLLRASFSK